MKDYYKILGVEKGASKDDVKKAFRKLSSQFHPDKKTGDESKYKEITEAYAVLGDEKKRAEYDTYGHSFSGGGGSQGFNWQDFSQGGGFQGGEGVEFDIGDIFENFGFGGGRSRAQRGRDISIDIELTLKESVFGVVRKVLLTKNSTCEECKGSGAKQGTEMTTCSTCDGNGKIRETRQSILGSFSTVRECNVCLGKGKVPKERCPYCAGMGVRKKEEEIQINVPDGIQNGEVIRMTGRGEAIPNGEPGDLYIKVHVTPHEKIKRDGNNLVTTLPVRLSDALIGSKYTVETFDGQVEIAIPAGIAHGELLRIKGKGVSIGGRRGDFMVRIKVEIPKKLSRRARKLVEELREEGI